ncbi:putative quinol monooxygenase [Actinoplanes sp. NPDC051861]|uniref:putative quinol monooxygenase n=1 Tax=Actinoplanes sp. NPDC051861 TaxID=3155170 RepID=UPI00342CE2F4
MSVVYGYLGSMKARSGHRDEVVEILTGGADGLRAAGCHLYVVGVSESDDQTIWVSEVWDSKEHHDASLQLPETRAAIARAMPMLTGEFDSHEIAVVGGLGVPVAND